MKILHSRNIHTYRSNLLLIAVALAVALAAVSLLSPFITAHSAPDALISASPLTANSSDDLWDARFGPRGTNGRVYAIVVADGITYIGGQFTSVGGIEAHNIAAWDGKRWQALGSGLTDSNYSSVAALAASNGKLYVGGHFDHAGGIYARGLAVWDGAQWGVLNSGIGSLYGSTVNALAAVGDTLYAGGQFDTIGGVIAANVAAWNGTTWSPLGSGITGGPGPSVYALAIHNNLLYVGGNFPRAGGIPAANIATWDGTDWSALGPGAEAAVLSLTAGNGLLYAGGYFTQIGGTPANGIASWDGAHWSPIGSGISIGYSGLRPSVQTIVLSGTVLYAGGDFGAAGGAPAHNIAAWDGTSWQSQRGGVSGGDYGGFVYALALTSLQGETVIYAGGDFTQTDQGPVNHLATWNGSDWRGIGYGLDGWVLSIANSPPAFGGMTYVGGTFHEVGGVDVDNIAAWDGARWSTLGSDVEGGVSSVDALLATTTTLYAGGDFGTIGGVGVWNVAAWDGSNWHGLGQGLAGRVRALAVIGDKLYAGGQFTSAGGVGGYNHIAMWDGTGWYPLGSGMLGTTGTTVSALAVMSGTLYAAGEFTEAGGVEAHNIAAWNGVSWSPLGSGIYGYARAMSVMENKLYVAGEFFPPAVWDGTSWSVLGDGLDSEVYSLAASGGIMYAGGYFTHSGNLTVNHVAAWDGVSWSALGSGTSGGAWGGRVFAVAAVPSSAGEGIFAGGEFRTAGASPSDYFGMYVVSTPSPSPTPTLILPTNTSTPIPPTPTACSIEFTDVQPGSTFYPYVQCLACRGIINGYPGGTFQPNSGVSRGQLAKIVSGSAGFNDPQDAQFFQDVPVGSTFQVYIGRLASRGIVSGYACGGSGEPCIPPANLPYFRPGASATRGQIGILVSTAAGFEDTPSGQQFEDLPMGSTYYTSTYRLAVRNVLSGYPCGAPNELCVPPGNLPYFRPNNPASRGQTSKIVASAFFQPCILSREE